MASGSEGFKSINKNRARIKAAGGSAASNRKPKLRPGNSLGFDGKPAATSAPF